MGYKIFHSETSKKVLEELKTYNLEGFDEWKSKLLDDAQKGANGREGDTVVDWVQALERVGKEVADNPNATPPKIWKYFWEADVREKMGTILSLIRLKVPFSNRAVNRLFSGLGGQVFIDIWIFYEVDHVKRQIIVRHIEWS